MTKLDYVLSGKGEKQLRCIYAAFCFDYENGEAISKFYDINNDEFPWPWHCIEIIKKEYKQRVNRLSGDFIFDLISKMMQTHTEASEFKSEINECINDFMNS